MPIRRSLRRPPRLLPVFAAAAAVGGAEGAQRRDRAAAAAGRVVPASRCRPRPACRGPDERGGHQLPVAGLLGQDMRGCSRARRSATAPRRHRTATAVRTDAASGVAARQSRPGAAGGAASRARHRSRQHSARAVPRRAGRPRAAAPDRAPARRQRPPWPDRAGSDARATCRMPALQLAVDQQHQLDAAGPRLRHGAVSSARASWAGRGAKAARIASRARARRLVTVPIGTSSKSATSR